MAISCHKFARIRTRYGLRISESNNFVFNGNSQSINHECLLLFLYSELELSGFRSTALRVHWNFANRAQRVQAPKIPHWSLVLYVSQCRSNRTLQTLVVALGTPKTNYARTLAAMQHRRTMIGLAGDVRT